MSVANLTDNLCSLFQFAKVKEVNLLCCWAHECTYRLDRIEESIFAWFQIITSLAKIEFDVYIINDSKNRINAVNECHRNVISSISNVLAWSCCCGMLLRSSSCAR